MDALSDADCLAHSLSEPRAFAPIFDRHFGAIHRYVHRRAGRDLADELAAETFALAFERRASCRASDSVLPWLYGIATNLLHRHRRVERRQLDAYARSGVNNWVAYEDDAAARVGDSSHGAQLARALAAMPPRERDALLLYALADLSSQAFRESIRSIRSSRCCSSSWRGHGLWQQRFVSAPCSGSWPGLSRSQTPCSAAARSGVLSTIVVNVSRRAETRHR
jgi:RNA polymerase sigma-70 factor, ECF subfamily